MIDRSDSRSFSIDRMLARIDPSFYLLPVTLPLFAFRLAHLAVTGCLLLLLPLAMIALAARAR